MQVMTPPRRHWCNTITSLLGGQEACAKWARDRILVQGMPLLVAQGYKLSGNACVVPCFKENEVVWGHQRPKRGGKRGNTEIQGTHREAATQPDARRSS